MTHIRAVPAEAAMEPSEEEPRADQFPVPEASIADAVDVKRGIKVNTALRFYHDVVGLDHLHFGLWNGEPRTLDGLKAAQVSYAEHLLDWLPSSVRRVLDVGSGTGAITSLLAQRGLEVEGLAPDPYQQALFRRRVTAPFHLSRFQDFDPPHAYDLVLMSESAQYIWLPDFFPAVRRTAPGGFLLVSDYFRITDDDGPHSSSGHSVDEFLERAVRSGLSEVRREDITDLVTPTLDLARGWLDRFVEPTLQLLVDRYPSVFKIGRWVAPSLFQKLDELEVLVDSGEFSRAKRYLVILFEVPEGDEPIATD